MPATRGEPITEVDQWETTRNSGQPSPIYLLLLMSRAARCLGSSLRSVSCSKSSSSLAASRSLVAGTARVFISVYCSSGSPYNLQPSDPETMGNKQFDNESNLFTSEGLRRRTGHASQDQLSRMTARRSNIDSSQKTRTWRPKCRLPRNI